MVKAKIKKIVSKVAKKLGLRTNSNLDNQKFSYSNEEQIIAKYLSLLELDDKTLVEIGASDGVYMSNTFKLLNDGWHGILFEPNGEHFESLAKVHRSKNVQLVNKAVTPFNICKLLLAYDLPKEFSFLNLDKVTT